MRCRSGGRHGRVLDRVDVDGAAVGVLGVARRPLDEAAVEGRGVVGLDRAEVAAAVRVDRLEPPDREPGRVETTQDGEDRRAPRRGSRSPGRRGHGRRSRGRSAVTTRRSRSGTGHPGCQETPVICRARAGEIGVIAPGEATVEPRAATAKTAAATPTAKSRIAFIGKSGWSDSNRRNLPSPKRALYQAELHPAHTLVRPYSMTVRADQLALGHLIEDEASTVPIDEPAEISSLDCSGKMVPVHRRVMKAAAAIDTRAVLEIPIPLNECSVTLVRLTPSEIRVPPVVFRVVHLPAFLAPRLPAAAR